MNELKLSRKIRDWATFTGYPNSMGKVADEVKALENELNNWRESQLKVDGYKLRKYSDDPDYKNAIWIEKESGEGMCISLDKIWEQNF